VSIFRLTPDAKEDLIKIRRFTVKQWGIKQSQKYLSDLRQTIKLLAETPTLGKSRPDVGLEVFSFPHVSHVIYYFTHKQKIVVFGILHKGMVPQNHLVDREFFNK
jgi:toxin ParE1/3/4